MGGLFGAPLDLPLGRKTYEIFAVHRSLSWTNDRSTRLRQGAHSTNAFILHRRQYVEHRISAL